MKREKGQTLFGAIGHCMKAGPLWQVRSSTNAKNFQEFVADLAAHVGPMSPRPILLLDNASAHRSKASLAAASQYFDVIF